jgi:tetratricopeptide (TPR) repeat protein
MQYFSKKALLVCLLTSTLSSYATVYSQNSRAQDSALRKRSLELNEKGSQLAQKGNYLEAQVAFSQALETDKRNITAVYNLAGMYLHNKRPKQAVKLLGEYVDRDKTDAGLATRLGDAYFSSKDVKNAQKWYREALTRDASYPETGGKLAALLTLSGKLDEAEKILVQAIKSEPKNSQLKNNLAALLLSNKKPQDAIKLGLEVAKTNPSPEIYITLGSSYSQTSEYKKALDAYKKAKELGDTSSELQAEIERLKVLSET